MRNVIYFFAFLFLQLVFVLGQPLCEDGDLIYIHDFNLQKAIIDEIGEINAYTCEGLQKLQVLKAVNKGIVSLDGLQYAQNLQSLVVPSNLIENLAPLTFLKNLTVLVANDNHISSLYNINNLSSLTTLNISDNNIDDISPVLDLDGLTALGVGGNPISYNELKRISGLKKINVLHINDLQLTSLLDVFPLLYDYESLVLLNIDNNTIGDLEQIYSFPKLRFLFASNNGISNIQAISSLKSLENLYLIGNEISDISPLSQLENLSVLMLINNKIRSAEPLKELKNLKELHFTVNSISNIGDSITENSFKLPEKSLLKIGWNCLSTQDKFTVESLGKAGIQVEIGQQFTSSHPRCR